ncbi:MAG: hypothetical protein M0P77_07745 [Firmicutes bacterium]|nr:hypothetical protein [Bacillota bacterium]
MLQNLRLFFSWIPIKHFFLLVCIFYSSSAITFYQSSLGYGVLLVFSVLMMVLYRIPIHAKLLIALFIWLVYCVILVLVYGELELTLNHFVRYATLILASYTLIKLFSTNLFYKFEKAVSVLAIISLFFWLWHLISPGSLTTFSKIINFGSIANSSFRNSEFYYILFYVLEIFSYSSNTLQRNYGFCIEPVVFACFLLSALFFNVMRNNGFKWKNNKNLWILILTLISTQSTTGVFAFMFFVIYYFISDKNLGLKRYILFTPILVILIILFIKIDFLFPKISEMYQNTLELDEMIYRSNPNARFSAGRMGGLVIGWNDLISHPILGIGPNSLRSYAYTSNAALYNTNGFAGIMSIFGLFGLSIYFFLTIKTSIFISKFYNMRLKFGFFIVLTLLLNGVGVYRTAIFFSLIIFSYFVTNNNLLKNTKEEK